MLGIATMAQYCPGLLARILVADVGMGTGNRNSGLDTLRIASSTALAMPPPATVSSALQGTTGGAIPRTFTARESVGQNGTLALRGDKLDFCQSNNPIPIVQ